jgi:hypothetical protein
MVLTRAQRRRISRFASGRVRGNDAMHGMPHLRQTARLAVLLAKAEGADCGACWAAAMLHDICKAEKGDHGALGAKDAAEFLRSMGLPAGFVRTVQDAIRFHNKGFRSGPLERQVLWDADKLPLMGPRGFRMRMLPYWAGKLGRAEGIRISAREYLFYKKRFHTASARALVEKDAPRMGRLIARLTASPG